MTPEELVAYITQPAVAEQLWQALVVPHLDRIVSMFDFGVGLLAGLGAGWSFVRGFIYE